MFLSLNKTADAAEYTFSPVSATPTADRGTCGTGELNGFTAYISNQSFNSTSGTFFYNVNVKWGRCQLNGDDPTSRAYAIFGSSSLCPNSGTYGDNGLAYDCVKYVGSPAYSKPSDLNGPNCVNTACTTSAFNAAIVEQQYPDFPYPTSPSRTYSQSYTIPNWSNVISSSTSYSVPTTRMCQYYKIAFPSWVAVDNNNCLDMSISVSWTKNYYAGTVQTNKWLAGTTNTLNDPTVSNADITLSWGGQCGPNSLWSSAPNTQQSWQMALWVNPCDSSVSTQGDYNNSIVVPTGYKLNRVQLTGGDTDLLTTVCTDNTNKRGTCTASGVRVVNGTYTYVNWFLEKIPPTLTVSCTSDNGATGGYITVTASSNIPGDTNPVIIKEAYDSDALLPRTLNTSPESFDINSKYRDGYHTYSATYGGLEKSVAFGPAIAGIPCNIDKWYYPWLQTSQGDVVADGKIEGQTTSTGTGTLGARLDNAAAKEAEFLVISAVGGDGPFCSTYKYILTNTSSQGTNCGNGLGYNFNSTGIDNDTVDRVIGGVKQAFADNGNNATPTPPTCTTTKPISTATVTAMPASISTDCPGGVIYKLSSGTLGATTLTKGRATIFVEGNLTITGNISSASSPAQLDPRLAPTLAIVVTGNINIDPTVSAIYAQLYSAKKINTCTANTNECSLKRLVVVGSLSAKTGFEFKRTFVDTAYQNSAERIKMNGIALAFPPPGIDSRYFYNNFSSYKLDSAEYNPRF